MYMKKVEREKRKMKRILLARASKTSIGSCKINLLDFDLVDDSTFWAYVNGLSNTIALKCMYELDKDTNKKITISIKKFSSQIMDTFEEAIPQGLGCYDAKIAYCFGVMVSICDELSDCLGPYANSFIETCIKEYEQKIKKL